MQLIGYLELDKNKKGKMVLALPFWGNSDFFVVVSDKIEEKYPSFFVWNKKIKIGALWKSEYVKEGETKKYLSGNVFCPFLESKKMKLVVFEDKNRDGDLLWKGSVFWSFEERKPSEIIDDEVYEQGTEDRIF